MLISKSSRRLWRTTDSLPLWWVGSLQVERTYSNVPLSFGDHLYSRSASSDEILFEETALLPVPLLVEATFSGCLLICLAGSRTLLMSQKSLLGGRVLQMKHIQPPVR
jgi:hypothetical protein